MAAEAELLEAIKQNATKLAHAIASYRAYQNGVAKQAQDAQRGQSDKLDKERNQELRIAEAEYKAAAANTQQKMEQLHSLLDYDSHPWSKEAWGEYEPAEIHQPPELTRIGTFVEGDGWKQFGYPALLPIIGRGNLLIEAANEQMPAANSALRAILLRLLATVPAGKLRFLFIDPVGLGQNVAGFLRLDGYSEELVGARAWTEPEHIEQRLADISEHMETVIQKYLRGRYDNMEAYNREAEEVAEPYRIVVAINFPVNFTERAAQRLISVAGNGPKCGVHVLATVDLSQPAPTDFLLSELERVSYVVDSRKEQFFLRSRTWAKTSLQLDTPPEEALFDEIINKVGAASKVAQVVRVPFARIQEADFAMWAYSSARAVDVPIGRAGARRIQRLELGEGTAQHALIAGKTGSGKSNLLHIAITNLMMHYSPDELELYLIDFKKGVEFRAYADDNLPHVRVVAIESEREFGLSVLQGLDKELTARGEAFRAVGVNYIADYRRVSGRALPRILLLVDEYQEFFGQEDNLAGQAGLLLDRLVRQGRAFGMHTILGSQTLAGSYSLARSTIDQMAVRIALQCSDADSRLILSEDNGAARLLSRPGEAVYNSANGLLEGNQLFQVAWLPDAEWREQLHRVAQHGLSNGYRRKRPIVVFEGNEPANMTTNAAFRALLERAGTEDVPRQPYLVIGEPVSMEPLSVATLSRQYGSNLLLLGQNERAAVSTLSAVYLTLAAQFVHRGARFVHLDFTNPEEEWFGLARKLAQLLPEQAAYGQRRDLLNELDGVYRLVKGRVEQDDADGDGHVSGAPLFLFLWGMQRARDLRSNEEALYGSKYSWDEPEASEPSISAAEQFAHIIKEGPEAGVHVLAWCDTYANLQRTVQRNEIRAFDLRIAFQMNSEDSTNYIDTPRAGKIGPNRALFLDEFSGRLEIMRPFGLPQQPWLEEIEDVLHPTHTKRQRRRRTSSAPEG